MSSKLETSTNQTGRVKLIKNEKNIFFSFKGVAFTFYCIFSLLINECNCLKNSWILFYQTFSFQLFQLKSYIFKLPLILYLTNLTAAPRKPAWHQLCIPGYTAYNNSSMFHVMSCRLIFFHFFDNLEWNGIKSKLFYNKKSFSFVRNLESFQHLK